MANLGKSAGKEETALGVQEERRTVCIAPRVMNSGFP